MYNIFMFIQNISILFTIGSIFYIMRQSPSKLQRDMLLLQCALLINIMSYTLEMTATNKEAAIVALKMGYVAKPIIFFVIFFVIVDFVRINVKSSIKTISAAIQVVFVIIIFTFEKHSLFYKSVEFVNEGLFPHLVKVRGPLYFIYITFVIGYSIGMVVVCIIKAKSISSRDDRKLLFAFAIIIALPIVGYGIYITNLSQGYNMNVLGMSIDSFIFTLIFSKYNVFGTVNVAWENVFKHIGAGLLVYDRFGGLIYQNDMAREMNIADKAAELYKSREYIYYKDGVFRVERLSINSEGNNLGFAYYIDNETDNYKYELLLKEEKTRAYEENVAKTRFLSSMSHDIRTPMNAILGLTDIAKMHIDDKERVEDSLNKINTSGKHLLDLINEVLDISKIESGKFELMKDDFDIVELFDDIGVMSKPLIDSKKHTLSIDTSGVEHSWVTGDKSRFSQVIMNLVSNAVKYTNNGGLITIKMSETKSGETENVYKIVVRDNGIGMSEEYLPTLFDPFTRAKDEVVYKAQGTGLGMSITKQFVELMGGTISVRSTLGIGTTFTIIVPMAVADEATRAISDKKLADFSKVDLKGKKVLVVEDNEVNAEIMGELLKITGMEVEYARDGLIAVETLEEVEDGYFDLIFMDVEMPRMNGYEATKNIRSMSREYAKNVPIIAVTGNAFSEDIKRALEAGMNAHITKPVEYNKLYEVLAEYC